MGTVLNEAPLHKNPDLLDAFIRDVVKDGLAQVNSITGSTLTTALNVGPIMAQNSPGALPFIRYGVIEEWLPQLGATDTSQDIQRLIYKGTLLTSGTTTGGWTNGTLLYDATKDFDALKVTPDMFVLNKTNTHVTWNVQTQEKLDSHRLILTDMAFFDPRGGEQYEIYNFVQQNQWSVPRKIPLQIDFYGTDVLNARHLAEAFRDYLHTRKINDTLDATARSRLASGGDYFYAYINEVSRVTPTDYIREDGRGVQHRRSLTLIFRVDEWLYT